LRSAAISFARSFTWNVAAVSSDFFESDSKKSDDTAATFDVEDLAKEMDDLRKKGVTFEEYDLPGIKTVRGVATMGGETAAWFKDPGGNVICLHQAKRK